MGLVMSGIKHSDARTSALGDVPQGIAVVGCSAGGLTPLRALIGALPLSDRLSVIIAQHVAHSFLPELIGNWSAWPAGFAADGSRIRPGRVYVCPPTTHLVVNPDATFRVARRERIEFHRPSITWLFESTSASFYGRTIAVVLSGGQADGATGAARVERNEGRVIVQDPETALHPQMPLAALRATKRPLVVHPGELARAIEFQMDSLDLVDGSIEWRQPFNPVRTTFAAS